MVLSVGCGSSSAPAGSTITNPPAPTLASITPSTASAGGAAMVLQASGTNFVPGSEITWNGTERATLYVSSTTLQMNLASADLVTAATVKVGVTDPTDVGGASSNSLDFLISQDSSPNPVPALTSLTPSSAVAGASNTTITLAGSGFVPSSVAQWNGTSLASTYESSTSLTAVVPASDLTAAGTDQVSVLSPAPGGGTSNTLPFVLNAVTTSNGLTTISLQANDLAWDPVNQVIYLSLPSAVGSNGNSVQVLDPFNGTLGASVFAGSEPDLLAVSQSSKYLYTALDGSSSLQRFLLPALTPDINISFGAASFYGPYLAMDLQPSPTTDGTVAFVLGALGVSPEEEGGLHIYDDAVMRPNYICGWIEIGCTGINGDYLLDSVQWSPTANEMYALNDEDTGFDFYEMPVNAQGFSTVQDFGALAGGFGDAIHYDATTNMIYTNDGVVIDPTTGDKAGTFDASGLAVPDGKNGVIYFIGQPFSGYGSGTFTIESFDINHFTPISSVTVKNVIGSPSHFIRWGANGLAFTSANYDYSIPATATGAVYLFSGSFVSSSNLSSPQPENVHRTLKPANRSVPFHLALPR